MILKYSEDVQTDLKEAERGNHNFPMVFEENVLRSIGEIDKALLYLRRSIETRKDSTDFATIANTTDVLSEIIVQVAIIDAAGIMRASNVGPQPAPPLDLSDRDHYQVHVNRGPLSSSNQPRSRRVPLLLKRVAVRCDSQPLDQTPPPGA